MQITCSAHAHIIYKVWILVNELNYLLCSQHLGHIQGCRDGSLLRHASHNRTCRRHLYFYLYWCSRWINHLKRHILIPCLERCQIYSIPYILICFQIDGHAISKYKLSRIFTRHKLLLSSLIHAELHILICGHLHIEGMYIFVDELLHHLEDKAWDTQRESYSTWHIHSTASCDIVFATYSSTHGQFCSLTTHGLKIESRQTAHICKQCTIHLVPRGTCRVNICFTNLQISSILTTQFSICTRLRTLCLCGDRNLVISSHTYIEAVQLGRCEIAIIYHLIHAHTCRDWECQRKSHLEWAIQ